MSQQRPNDNPPIARNPALIPARRSIFSPGREGGVELSYGSQANRIRHAFSRLANAACAVSGWRQSPACRRPIFSPARKGGVEHSCGSRANAIRYALSPLVPALTGGAEREGGVEPSYGSRANRIRHALSRLVDVALAASGLLLTLPVLAMLALVVLMDDGPPVLFSQTRVGKDGKPFRIWKFRTMNAGSRGSPITASGDTRITRSGAVLRRYKLDELPQLFNVLKGDMSLVGPRPETPEYVEPRAPAWQAVLTVRPGITDLATLLYRDEEEILGASANADVLYRETLLPDKLRLNLAYLRARSFRQDLRLILLTVRYSLFPHSFDPNRVRRTFGIGLEYD